MDTLVTTEWLADNLGAEGLVVLDCTVHLRAGADGFESQTGRDDFTEGHIAGAGFADLLGDLVDTDSPHGFAIPTPEHFGAAMERLGVTDHSRVVLYDNNQSMWAARVWWMLRWVGFDNAAILDGGLKAWESAGNPVSNEACAETSCPMSMS